ncbi:NAD(P)-dependent oxidoreductase [Camelimonas fluminis]|uniref:SDR family oxidoreductase n=1 Tax=Camelimonas fluminis TaxID=1576911 RepID=A0ABV7UFP3_9HYPH|nr:SDR family oxidoreductase [Camelimonas fluminis]GHE81699.1 NAD(P)-dependent oxidoreductase [Camelimonas fluminis]
MHSYPKPPFPRQQQSAPGLIGKLNPPADHGEKSWRGAGRLAGRRALITGGDSGIGRAVAIAFAREGADVALSFLNEGEDAASTASLVQEAGRKCVLLPGDIGGAEHCRFIAAKAMAELGTIDVLVNNAAQQAQYDSLDNINDDAWRHTFDINIHAMFYLSKALITQMPSGSVIINTASVNSDRPNPSLLPYATTKGAIVNFTAGLAQLVARKGIRVNAVAPGPVWTPLIPSTMSEEDVREFGANYPMGRPAQPVELASAYVMLAEPMSSYVSGAVIAVTGGAPYI